MSNQLIWHVHEHVIPAALSLLPAWMDSREAKAMLLAIGLQETEFNARVQGGKGPNKRGEGPARGFWQFERNGGVVEILTSPDTKPLVMPILSMMLYPPNKHAVHEALADNDVLAAVFARLLLSRDARANPTPIESQKGWDIYLKNWRPGAPHPKTWQGNFTEAWRIVQGK